MSKMDKLFEQAAVKIKRAIFLHQPIILRHDNDSDGLCAALALHKSISGALHLKVIAQEWPLYKTLDAEADLRYLNSFEAEYLNPILICADFGANPESINGYTLIKKEKAGFEIIVIDHHPMQEPKVKELIDVLVSPWVFGTGSSYATGLLASEISQRISDVDVKRYANIALFADRSKLVKWTKEGEKYSMALEYLISTSKFPQTIETFSKVIDDEETLDLAYAQAQEKVGDMLNRLKGFTKTKRYGIITAFVINTDKLSIKGQFPRKGVITSFAADYLGKNNPEPVITVGYSQRNMNMRLNPAALKAGINCSDIVVKVKEALGDAIEGGGGHPGASALRVRIGFSKIALDQLLKEVKAYAIK